MQCEALLEEEACSLVVAPSQRDPAERPDPVRDAADVPELTRRAHALLDQALGLVELPAPGMHDAGVGAAYDSVIRSPDRRATSSPSSASARARSTSPSAIAEVPRRPSVPRDRPVISQPAKYRQARLAERRTASWSPCMYASDAARREPTPAALPSRSGGPAAAPGARGPRVGSSQLPVAPERGADPQTDVRLVFFGRPGQRRAEVVALGVEPLEPAQLLWPE